MKKTPLVYLDDMVKSAEVIGELEELEKER